MQLVFSMESDKVKSNTQIIVAENLLFSEVIILREVQHNSHGEFEALATYHLSQKWD